MGMTMMDDFTDIVLSPCEKHGDRALVGEAAEVLSLLVSRVKKQYLLVKRPAVDIKEIPDDELVAHPERYLKSQYAIELPMVFSEKSVCLNMEIHKDDIAPIVALIAANAARRKENERKKKYRRHEKEKA